MVIPASFQTLVNVGNYCEEGHEMPLLKGRFVSPVRQLKDVDPKEPVYTISHTKEQFRSKEEYERRLAEYEESVWTCQCTGQIKLTHKDAFQSEQDTRKILKQQFPSYLEKPVLEIVHHSTEVLEVLTERAWQLIHCQLFVGEPVKIAYGSTIASGTRCDGDQELYVDGTVYKINKTEIDSTEGSTCGGSPSSNKENSGDESSVRKRLRSTPNKSQNQPKSPKKFQLLPYKYGVKLDKEDKVISAVPVKDIIRKNKLPLKETLKTFIRSFAWRGGFHFNSPWVVTEELVQRHSLTNKLADIFLSPAKMTELGRKALAEKRKASDSTCKKRKRSESAEKRPSNKKLKTGSTPKNQNASSFKDNKKNHSSKKSTQKETPRADEPSECESDDNMTLAELKKSPDKLQPKSPVKSVNGSPKKGTPLKVGTPSSTPRKRGRPTKAESERRKAELENMAKSGLSGKKGTPKKQTDNKKMKQATLFDMKSKKKEGSTPKKSPTKQVKSPSKSPFKLPPLAARLMKDPSNKALIIRCASQIPVSQIRKLPDAIRDLVLKKYNVLEEKKLVKKMTPEQLEEHKKKKKEELKQKLRVMMRKRWRDQNKRVEDTFLDLKSLPVPKVVDTPDGIANEQFGDAAMITEFISCYKDLLMPEDDTSVAHVTTSALLNSLVSGSEGFNPTAKVLVTLLQTLLQDGIAEDYRELGVPLSSLPVNVSTVSELVRLCLRRRDLEDTASDASDQNETDDNDLDLRDDVLEQLEMGELYELSASDKLQILTAVCHRLMGSYSVQDDLEQKQKEYQELWKQRNQYQKEKNDERRDAKQKRKEQKSKGVTVEPKTEEIADSTENGCTIGTFYGKKSEDETNLASVVRSRRMMAVKAVDDRRRQERDDKIRREKEFAELRKQRDRENVEKKFQEASLAAKWVSRQTPLGTDRNHDRYWMFHSPTPGLFVEKGWASKDISYNTRPKKGKFSDTDSSSEDDLESDSQDIKRGRRKRDPNRNMEKTFPHTGQNLWFVFDTVEDVDRLIKNLHPQGIRESALKTNLQTHYEYITNSIKTLKGLESAPVEGLDIVDSFREELLEMEGRLRLGGLGGVMDYTTWETQLRTASDITDFAECLLQTQTHVLEKFQKGVMLDRGAAVSEDGGGTLVEDQGTPTSGLQRWQHAARSCPTFSRLHVLMGILDSCIKWEKSAENAKCKICRRKGDEDRLLLCDDCNQAYHLYCMRPALLEVPSGDWLCAACTPLSVRRGSRSRNYRELAGEEPEEKQLTVSRTSRYGRTANFKQYADDESEESSESEEEENESECARCGGDEGIYPCSTCPSSFHLGCHQPPLLREPRSTWRCFQCLTGERIKPPPQPTRGRPTRTRQSVYDVDEDYSTRPRAASHRARAQPEKRSTRTARRPPQRYVEYASSLGEESESSEETDDSSEQEEEEDTAPARNKDSSQISKRRHSNSSSKLPPQGACRSPSSQHQTRQKGSSHLVNGDYAAQELLDTAAKTMMDILVKLRRLKSAWPFLEPVDTELVPDYLDIVKNPMDLQTIENKCLSEVYKDPQQFVDDISLMLDNSHLYNKPDSYVGKCTEPVENLFCKLLVKHLPQCSYARRNISPQVVINGHASSDSDQSTPPRRRARSPGTALGDHAYYSPVRPSKPSI